MAHLFLAHEAEVGAGAAGVLVIAGRADVVGAVQAHVQAGVQAGLLGAARFVVALCWVREEASIQPAPAAPDPHLHGSRCGIFTGALSNQDAPSKVPSLHQIGQLGGPTTHTAGAPSRPGLNTLRANRYR